MKTVLVSKYKDCSTCETMHTDRHKKVYMTVFILCQKFLVFSTDLNKSMFVLYIKLIICHATITFTFKSDNILTRHNYVKIIHRVWCKTVKMHIYITDKRKKPFLKQWAEPRKFSHLLVSHLPLVLH